MKKSNLNDIELTPTKVGNERKLEMLNNILSGSTLLPRTVEYKDIDKDFRRWVEEDLIITSDEGKKFPTITLYSNQRFSEYSQTWQSVDVNNNLLLNFKSITRENNPQYGKIQNGLWNIPGDRFYTMKKEIVQDENGTESFRELKMKQPVAIDINYKLSIFTTKYQSLNEFNTIINKKFAARQCYLEPNGHYMPMTLEGIDDESEYSIDDRQFYSQSYTIKLLGYILTEDDFKVEETPLKRTVSVVNLLKKKKADVEIDECEDVYNPYGYKVVTLTYIFPPCTNSSEIKIDTRFVSESFELENILNNYTITVNDNKINDRVINVNDGDKIKITIKRRHIKENAKMIIHGYNPDIVFDERLDYPESDLDIKQFDEEREINVGD